MKTKLLTLFLIFGFAGYAQINFKINSKIPKYSTDYEERIDKLNFIIDSLTNKLSESDRSLNDYKSFYEEVNNQGVKFKTELTVYDIYLNGFINELISLKKEKASICENINLSKITVSQAKDIEDKINTIDKNINLLLQKKQAYIDANDLRNKGCAFLSFGKKLSNGYYNLMYSNNGENLRFLTDAGINFGSNSGAVYSELASGILGVFRLSVGTMVANSSEENKEEETQDEAFQRLASNGGNTVLKVEYPLVYWCAEDNQYNFIGRFLGKAAADFPAFGTQTDDFSGSVSGGLDFYIDGATTNGEIRLYSNFNISTYKSSEQFKENLGIEKTEFTFGTMSGGLIISNKVNLSIIFNTFSSEKNLRNRNVIIGGSLLL